jgi:hypothetical protein
MADLADFAGLVPDLDQNSGGDSQTSFLKRYKKAYLHIFFPSEKKVHTLPSVFQAKNTPPSREN